MKVSQDAKLNFLPKFTFNENEEDPYCSKQEIPEQDVETRVDINLVLSEILNHDEAQEASGQSEEQGNQPESRMYGKSLQNVYFCLFFSPCYCVWGEAEEG